MAGSRVLAMSRVAQRRGASRGRTVHGGGQAGVALISVLLIVAVLTAIVYQLLGRHSLSIAQSRNTLGFDQALSYALGAETLTRQALYEDFSETGPGIDTLAEPWAQAIPPFEIDEEGFLEIKARDLNRCFNLNALAGQENAPASQENAEPNLKRFKTLLTILGIPDTVADAVRDWVDADEAVHGFGAEDSEYLLREPAYRPPNGPLAHVSELWLMAGLEPEYMDLLADHVCALPVNSLQINVNTATAPLFGALTANPNLDPVTVQTLTESVREYADIEKFLAEFPDFAPAAETLTVTSSYFEVQVRVQVGESYAVLTSQLYRHPESGAVRLLSRDMGKDFRSLFEVTIEDA